MRHRQSFSRRTANTSRDGPYGSRLNTAPRPMSPCRSLIAHVEKRRNDASDATAAVTSDGTGATRWHRVEAALGPRPCAGRGIEVCPRVGAAGHRAPLFILNSPFQCETRQAHVTAPRLSRITSLDQIFHRSEGCGEGVHLAMTRGEREEQRSDCRRGRGAFCLGWPS